MLYFVDTQLSTSIFMRIVHLSFVLVFSFLQTKPLLLSSCSDIFPHNNETIHRIWEVCAGVIHRRGEDLLRSGCLQCANE